MKPALVTIGTKVGRLGNRLTQFAHFIAFSEANSVPVISLAFDEYADYFEGTCNNLLCNYPSDLDISKHKLTIAFLEIYKSYLKSVVDYFATSYPDLPQIISNLQSQDIESLNANPQPMFRKTLTLLAFEFEEWAHSGKLKANGIEIISTKNDEDLFELDDPEFIDSCNQDIMYLCNGWLFRDHTNYPRMREKLRRFFAPRQLYRKNIDAHLTSCRQGVTRVVGVHIRQGDMREYSGGKNFFSTEKYIGLMHRIKSLFPFEGVRFLVCSDEKQDQANFGGLDVKFGTGEVIEDLYCLAGCDHLIAISSTFAAWAALMGECQVYSFEDIDQPIILREGRIVAA